MTWSPANFDKHAFAGRRSHAVSIESGISFSDYARMHVMRRARVQERRLPTPVWAVRDDWLRILLVTYLEERFYCKPLSGIDLATRLALARQSALYYAPRKQELLNDWLDDYHAISKSQFSNLTDEQVMEIFLALHEVQGQLPIDIEVARNYITRKKLRDLEIQIQNIDTDLVLTEKGHAEVIAAVVYLYYRLGWDSVTVAEQLGLKSPHVRQVLARLHSTWKASLAHLENKKPEPTDINVTTPFDDLFGAE